MHGSSILALMEPIACEVRTTKGESRNIVRKKTECRAPKKTTYLIFLLLQLNAIADWH